MTFQKHVYNYRITRQGDWLCEGTPVVDQDLLRILSRSLFIKNDQHWVRCEGEVHPVEVDDAPLTVVGVEATSDPEDQIWLTLADGRQSILTNTLTISDDNILYVKIGKQALLARFQRKPYYELTGLLQNDGDRYYIPMGAEKLFINRRT